jgi:hypothetical protein
MNTPVEFSIAKLLKEKGFNKSVRLCYDGHGSSPLPFNGGNDLYKNDLEYESAPTIAEVVMWLYEKYGIWIYVYEYKDHAADVNDDYVFRSNHTKNLDFKLPLEAYQSAIISTLKNLI